MLYVPYDKDLGQQPSFRISLLSNFDATRRVPWNIFDVHFSASFRNVNRTLACHLQNEDLALCGGRRTEEFMNGGVTTIDRTHTLFSRIFQ